jgi:hypothetical protein
MQCLPAAKPPIDVQKFPPNLTPGVKFFTKDLLSHLLKLGLMFKQARGGGGVGKLVQEGLLADIGGADNACFQQSKTAIITNSSLVECIGKLGVFDEHLVWVLVCGIHEDGDNCWFLTVRKWRLLCFSRVCRFGARYPTEYVGSCWSNTHLTMVGSKIMFVRSYHPHCVRDIAVK